MKTHIKICCIQSVDEARMAIDAGADALGLVSAMPSGPGPIHEELIAQIAPHITSNLWSVLLTSKLTAAEIIAQQRRIGVNTLQLVDAVPLVELANLRRELPGVRLMQVIHVTGEGSLTQAQEYAPHVDALLLDSGNPALAIKELGGTGRTHDWKLSRAIVESVHVPVFLAGGLNALNVVEAIRIVHPYGVDLCSGVRANGKLNSERLTSFVKAVAQIESAY
jgi:phosphoribosylanthranilate isomerase